uniref:Uncharacterized protein n=1 Tax=Glossina austeni TaxID=7395 RepID=A0A1A9VPA8_GLOAU
MCNSTKTPATTSTSLMSAIQPASQPAIAVVVDVDGNDDTVHFVRTETNLSSIYSVCEYKRINICLVLFLLRVDLFATLFVVANFLNSFAGLSRTMQCIRSNAYEAMCPSTIFHDLKDHK